MLPFKKTENKDLEKKIKSITKKTVTEKKPTTDNSHQIELIIQLFPTYLNIKSDRMYKNKTQRNAINSLLKYNTFEEIAQMVIKYAEQIKGKKYAPSINSPVDLFDKWNMLEDFIERNKLSDKKILSPKQIEDSFLEEFGT